jgi:hypothetical protein
LTLNVYSGPDVSFDITFTLGSGTTVTMIGRDPTSTWLEIQASDGETGWALEAQLDITPGFYVGTLPVPANIPTPPNNGGGGGGGGGFCTCNQICTCVPIYY